MQQKFTYGAVLKIEREHTREELRGMLLDMAAAHFNTVVVWPAVYWWEPEGDHYPYQTGRDLLEDAKEAGIDIVMELAGQITALEYAPDDLVKEEYFPVDRKGNRDEGSLGYGYLNFNHPEVKALIQKQYREIASAYREFPALKGYDIWNETQFTSFDPHTLALFQAWLKDKYQDIGQLNDSWDRAYRSFEEVRFTQWMWASVMAFVDYQEFHKDNIGIILRYMREAIEAVDQEHQILADNIHASVTMDHYYDRPTDDWTVARAVDQYGISFYPKFLSRFTPPHLRHQTMTGAHSAASDGRFAISEMQTHHATMFNPEGSVSPEELKLWCMEAISHGANGIIYWKWNPFRKGVQTFGRGLVDLQGRETPRLAVAREVGEFLKREPELLTTKPEAPKAAILFDRLNQDFIKAYTIGFRGMIGAPDSVYLDSLGGLYRTLWEKNVPSVFLTPEDIVAGKADEIPLLFVSNQVVTEKRLANALLAYAKKGGVVVADGKFGEVNETGLLYPQIPGAGLSDALQFELMDMEEGDLQMRVASGETICGGHDRRQIRIFGENVSTLATYPEGTPAILVTPVGRGKIVYISTFLWAACKKAPQKNVFSWIESLVCEPLKGSISCSEPGICMQKLEGSRADYLFVFCYGKAGNTTISLTEQAHVTEVLHQVDLGKISGIQVELDANETAVYKIIKG